MCVRTETRGTNMLYSMPTNRMVSPAMPYPHMQQPVQHLHMYKDTLHKSQMSTNLQALAAIATTYVSDETSACGTDTSEDAPADADDSDTDASTVVESPSPSPPPMQQQYFHQQYPQQPHQQHQQHQHQQQYVLVPANPPYYQPVPRQQAPMVVQKSLKERECAVSSEEVNRWMKYAPVGSQKLWKCLKCKRDYKTKYVCKRHVEAHLVHKPFECNNCERRFQRLDQLQRHRKKILQCKPARLGRVSPANHQLLPLPVVQSQSKVLNTQ